MNTKMKKQMDELAVEYFHGGHRGNLKYSDIERAFVEGFEARDKMACETEAKLLGLIKHVNKNASYPNLISCNQMSSSLIAIKELTEAMLVAYRAENTDEG